MRIASMAGMPEFILVGVAVTALGLAGHARFTQMDTASDVALAKSNMAALSSALDVYFSDNGAFPPGDGTGAPFVTESAGEGGFPVLSLLTTPIAYASPPSFLDPFEKTARLSGPTVDALLSSSFIGVDPASGVNDSFIYRAFHDEGESRWLPSGFGVNAPADYFVLHSGGPFETYFSIGGVIANETTADDAIDLMYDPTNGTVSLGGIWRFSSAAPTAADPSVFAAGTGLHSAWTMTDQDQVTTSAEGWERY